MALVTLLASTVGVSLLIHVVPGDPVMMMMAQNAAATPEAIENARRALGLDLPVWQQTLRYLGNILQGDFGRSIFGAEPVSTLLFDRLPNTLALGLCQHADRGGDRPAARASIPPTARAPGSTTS